MSGISSIGSGLASFWSANGISIVDAKPRDIFGRVQKEIDEKKAQNRQAKSAELENSTSPVTGFPVVLQADTANTLWQTQSFAQSADSRAVDAEEVADIDTTQETIPLPVQEKSAAEEFLDYMNRPTEDLLREAIMKELGYSEDDLEDMDPKERVKVEAKIKELVEQKIEESMKEEGFEIDISIAQS